MPPSSRGLGRHPFKVEIRGSNPLGGTPAGSFRRTASPRASTRSIRGDGRVRRPAAPRSDLVLRDVRATLPRWHPAGVSSRISAVVCLESIAELTGSSWLECRSKRQAKSPKSFHSVAVRGRLSVQNEAARSTLSRSQSASAPTAWNRIEQPPGCETLDRLPGPPVRGLRHRLVGTYETLRISQSTRHAPTTSDASFSGPMPVTRSSVAVTAPG